MGQGCVLLADRHLGMLQAVRDLLKARFGVVIMVSDETSLVEAVGRLAPDLAVADLSLPLEDGANIVRRLKGRFPGLRVLALSVHDEPEVARLVLAAGADGLVLKWAAATDLMPAVEAALRGDRFVSESPGGRGRLHPAAGGPWPDPEAPRRAGGDGAAARRERPGDVSSRPAPT